MLTPATVFLEKTSLLIDVLVEAVLIKTGTTLPAADAAWFATHCEQRFRYFHRNNAVWRKWLEDRNARIDPRNQCKVWIRHWLAAFIRDPAGFRERYVFSGCPDCGSDEWYENRSDGFVWHECDACGYKTVVKSPAAP